MGKKKTPTEKETRANLLGWARQFGCEAEYLKLMATYDELIKHAKTDDERRALAALAIADINKFFAGAEARQDYFLIDKKTGKKQIVSGE